MSKKNSIRLSNAHYVQSDIGFKRIAGYQEFELGGLDPSSRMSKISTHLFDVLIELQSRCYILSNLFEPTDGSSSPVNIS